MQVTLSTNRVQFLLALTNILKTHDLCDFVLPIDIKLNGYYHPTVELEFFLV